MKRLGTVISVIIGGVALAVLSPAVPAGATPPPVTHGDAMAVFQAAPTGGLAMLNHSPVSLGAPADLELRATIRPLADEGFDGRHYCVDDWHVIVLADIFGGDNSFNRQDFEELTSQDEFTFYLDSEELPTTRTATKHYNNAQAIGFEKAFVFQQGALMAPGELTVGEHTLGAVVVFPPDTFNLEITFFIDSSGTGACL